MSNAQDSSRRSARSAIEDGIACAEPAASSGRSPSKVAFKDQRDDYEYRGRYSDSGSSESEQTSCSTSSDASSSPDRSRRRHCSRRSGCDSRHGRRRRSSDRHRSRGHEPRQHRHAQQGASSSSTSTHAAAALAGPGHPGAAGPASGGFPPVPLPGAPPAAQPQLAIQGPQGVAACAGCLQPYHPYHPDQQLALALLPPPGSGPLPRSPSPSPSPAGHPGPTRAYTSPRSAQDPAPTLLLSPYGPQHHHQHHQHHQPGCPAAAAAYAAAGGSHPLAFPGSATPPASSLMEPMRMLALNGAAAARPLAPPAHPDPGPPPAVQYGVGPAAAAAMAAPPPHLYSLPPPPAPLPLSLPEPPQLSYAAQQQQQYHHQAGGLSMLYDETMQEVVLADAVMVKELAKQGHALVPLHDAYRTKLAALQSDVNGALLARREALMQQHARLAARAGEVAAQRAALEREVAVLAEDMVARIRGAESSKQSALGREVAEVGTHLEAIQRLLGDIVAASAAGPVDFLNAYSRLSDSCARLVSRPFKSVVDVAADDLPSEAAVYRDLAAAHEALGQLLGVKDSMISHLLRERDALQDELRQVVERYSSELSALEAQCQGYYQRLLALGDTGGEGPAAAAAGDSPTPTAATAGAGMGSARAEGSRVSLSSARGRGSTSWTQALELEAEAGRRGSGRR